MNPSQLEPGVLIADRYRLERLLGEGGMGTVWEATHTVTRRSVAMKFLKETMLDKPLLKKRFLREAATASALKHPNVVEVLDVFDLNERVSVLVMEYLRGETLAAKLKRDERLSVEETAALLLPVASAVGAAHALGIVHRDLKPENIFVVQDGDATVVKVLDFGIAKVVTDSLDAPNPSLRTDTGAMLGTPCYMAPEQATGEGDLDHRADIWSLGVILYECLSGSRPIEGNNLAQVVMRLMSAGIVPLARVAPELPPDLSAAVMKMLTRDSARRPASLLEISKVLAQHTRIVVPTFQEPGSVRPQPAAYGPASPVVESGINHGRSETLISSPAAPSSLTLNLPATKMRWPQFALIALAVAFVTVALSMLGTSSRSRDVPRIAGSPAVSEAPAPLPTLAPIQAATPLQPPLPLEPSASPAPSAVRKVTNPKLRRAKNPGGRQEAMPTEPPNPIKSRDEGTLFGGRK